MSCAADPQTYVNRVCDFIAVDRVVLAPHSDLGSDVNSFARAPKNRRLARRATAVINWLNSHQAYQCRSTRWSAQASGNSARAVARYIRASLRSRSTRLRERFLPEVEALEKLLTIDLSSWKEPRTDRGLPKDSRPSRMALG